MKLWEKIVLAVIVNTLMALFGVALVCMTMTIFGFTPAGWVPILVGSVIGLALMNKLE